MISLSAMSSSEIRQLRADVVGNGLQGEFVTAVGRFLAAHPLDSGADEDLVRTTGWRLAKAGFWDVVPPEALADTLSEIPEAAAQAFFEGVPDFYEQVPVSVRFVDVDALYSGPELHLDTSVSIPRTWKADTGTGEMRRDLVTGAFMMAGVGAKAHPSAIFGNLAKPSLPEERPAGEKPKTSTSNKPR